MGFFNKLWNWVRGKGYQETQEEEIIKQPSEPIETTPIQEPIQEAQQIEEPQKETQKTTIQKTRTIKEESDQEIEKFKQNLQGKPLKKDIEAKIDREQINKLNIQTVMTDIGELKPLYTKIFTDNAKLEDPDILNILIQNRKQLQHRFEATFKIYDKNGQVGELRTSGILIEHTNGLYKFVNEGQEIDYLREALEAAQSYFEQNYGAIGGNVNVTTNKKIKVTGINIDVTYA